VGSGWVCLEDSERDEAGSNGVSCGWSFVGGVIS
jgi:hypothetical protein